MRSGVCGDKGKRAQQGRERWSSEGDIPGSRSLPSKWDVRG